MMNFPSRWSLGDRSAHIAYQSVDQKIITPISGGNGNKSFRCKQFFNSKQSGVYFFEVEIIKKSTFNISLGL